MPRGKKGFCGRTLEMLPPPSEREVGLTAERVAQRLEQEREWQAARRLATRERRRVERALAALQIKLGL